MLAGIYPYRPNSSVGWVLFFVLALPVWCLFEFIGNWVFGGRFLSKLSRPVRIIWGVIIGSVWLFLILVALHFFKPFLGRWGS